ncbi:S-adenosyl-L-methionine-dependent methyltransferase [Cristinia sonorae]|uniref:S-adenosyl-L-methionine-dependent methyltransferase n=1 Tax=Cristinia sonorae TaxID=1940300 RepID=A0A8K0UMZ9_9AGAR|nr:S-adenosyl-L-methionine-dependent methyltransferase [Cristinia sonorae]
MSVVQNPLLVVHSLSEMHFSTFDSPEDIDVDSSSDTTMSDSSLDRFPPRSESSATSHDWEMRSASPQPSVYSMTSSLRQAAYRQEYGRGLNNYSDVYQLPADEEELQRLDHQHRMFTMVMDKYPPPLPDVLRANPEQPKAVVDLGCGSGSWILDIAREFPHCSAVAIDLVPMQNLELPPNCRSEVDDINLGLQHYFGAFDVAHARLICTGIRDYAGLVDHISHSLRPGGLVELTEYNFVIHDSEKRPIEIPEDDKALTGPWLPRWMNLARKAIRTRGGEVEAADHLHRWVSEHGSFEDVVHRQYWFQSSPWNTGTDPDSLRANEVAKIMRDDLLLFLKSGRPLLLGSGIPEQLVDRVESNTMEELQNAKTQLYLLIEDVYARKRADF